MSGGAGEPVVPDWPEGTAAVLTTAGDGAHAIPVSTAVRVGARAVHLALGRRRTALARLREDPRVALTVMAGADLAFTLHGRATVVSDDVAGTVGVRLEVERVQDHMKPDFTIEAAVTWRWTDQAAADRDAEVRGALRRLTKDA